MNNTYTYEISHSLVVESYAFWSGWWEPRVSDRESFKRVKSLDLYSITQSDLLSINHGVCPSCGGREIKVFTEPYVTGPYTNQYVMCICKILGLKERKWGNLESIWSPRKVSDLEALAKPNKDTAVYTKFIKDTTVNFIKDLGAWVYLRGGFGCGKTHLLWSIKSSLKGLALYVDASDLANNLRSSVGKNETTDMIDTISACPVLLVDDFGSEQGSEFLYSALRTIINRRYAKGVSAPTFVTSNLTQQELANSPVDNLRRIASRLSDNNLVTPLVSTQVDYRSLE